MVSGWITLLPAAESYTGYVGKKSPPRPHPSPCFRSHASSLGRLRVSATTEPGSGKVFFQEIMSLSPFRA